MADTLEADSPSILLAYKTCIGFFVVSPLLGLSWLCFRSDNECSTFGVSIGKSQTSWRGTVDIRDVQRDVAPFYQESDAKIVLCLTERSSKP